MNVTKGSVAWQLNLHLKKHKRQVIQLNGLRQDGSGGPKRVGPHRHDPVEAKGSQGTPWTGRQDLHHQKPLQAELHQAAPGYEEQITVQKKILIKYQAGLSITTLSVDRFSKALINSGRCRQGWLS